MTLKGYAAKISYSDENACFIGHIAGIADAIGLYADNVPDLRRAFEGRSMITSSLVKDQVALRKKPASGKLMLRVPPEVHGAALVTAQVKGMSLNQWAGNVLREAAHG